jgi:hypothetical protein
VQSFPQLAGVENSAQLHDHGGRGEGGGGEKCSGWS